MVSAEPSRVVSLSPANTEIAFALGAGDRVVGGTDADDYPPDAAALPDVVSQTKVLTEQIVALRPDLILAGGNDLTPQADVDRLRSLGYPVVVVYPRPSTRCSRTSGSSAPPWAGMPPPPPTR